MKRIIVFCIIIITGASCNMFEDISTYGGDFSLQTDIYVSTVEAPPKLFLSRDRGVTFNQILSSPGSDLDRWTVNSKGVLLTVENNTTYSTFDVFITYPDAPKTQIATFPNTSPVHAIAASPRGDFYLIAGVSVTYQLFRQPEGSTSPIQFVSNLPFSGTISNMWIIEDNNIEMTYFFDGTSNQLYRLTDGGSTFFLINNFVAAVSDIVPHRGNHLGNIVLAIDIDSMNIFSSADGSLFEFLSNIVSAFPYALHVDRNNRLYAATSAGLYFSDDATNWQLNSSFAPCSDVASDHTGRVYIIANGTIFISDTMGVDAFVLNPSIPNAEKIAVVNYTVP